MTITVISLRGGQPLPPGTVYVGRRVLRRAIERSPLANPQRLTRKATPEERRASIDSYRRWLGFMVRAGSNPAYHEFMRLVELARRGDLILACWCAPAPCHADVIRDMIEARLRLDAEAERVNAAIRAAQEDA